MFHKQLHYAKIYQSWPLVVIYVVMSALFLPVGAVEAGSHRIQIDVDRNIYPSQDPGFEYQANAKMLSVYFNQRNEEDKDWTLGIWVCANPEPKHWWHHHKTNTSAFFDLPQTDNYTVKANMITYHYKDIDIQFEILLDKVQRTIIVKSPQAIDNLASYLRYNAILSHLSAKALDSRRLGLDDGKDSGLYVQTMKMRDSSRTRIFHPKKKKRYAYITAHSQKETLKLNNDILELKVDWEWLKDKDRVFPVYINDEITGWQSVSSITLAGKFDGGNSASTLYDGTKTASSGVGGTCASGDTGVVAYNYGGSDYIDIDLGATYTVEQIDVYVACGTSAAGHRDPYVKVQYKDNGSYVDFGGTYELEVTAVCTVSQTLQFDVTDTSARYLRVWGKDNLTDALLKYFYIDEIEIYGTAEAAERKTRVNTPHSGKFTNGLVGYWSFDGANMDWSQTTAEARDQSGQDNHGDVTNFGKEAAVMGKVGQALSFDGSGDYINCGNVLNMGTNSFTVAGWVYPIRTDNEYLISKRTNATKTTAGYLLNKGSTFLFYLGDGTNGITGDAISSSLTLNQWNFVTAVVDRSSNLAKIYTNGIMEDSEDISSIGSVDSTNNLVFGEKDNGERFFNGTIDEVRIYNRALSEDEVEEMYQAGARKFHVNAPITDSLTSGLVGHWTFNGQDMDWSQTTAEARDQSGQGNHGDVTNFGKEAAVRGKVGQALSFDGSGDYVSVPDNASLDIAGAMTVSAWINADTLPGSGSGKAIVMKGASGETSSVNYNYFLYLDNNDMNPGNNVMFLFEDASGNNYQAYYQITLNTGQWYHLTGVYDTYADRILLYLDGSEVNESLSVTATPNTQDQPVTVGTTEGGYFFDGLIDEVRIYNRALSEDEIEALYNLGARRFRIGE